MPHVPSPTIDTILSAVFPLGTNGQAIEGTGEDLLGSIPKWLPDLFAATAVLLERSGVYTHPAFCSHADSTGADVWETWTKRAELLVHLDPAVREKEFQCISEKWTSLVTTHRTVTFLDQSHCRASKPPAWAEIAFELMQLADMACVNVGYSVDIRHNIDSISAVVHFSQQFDYLREHKERDKRVAELKQLEYDYAAVQSILEEHNSALHDAFKNQKPLPHVPASIARWVPPHVVCVQPKLMTPPVGQTIRSHSHNLALLPSQGEIYTFWFNAHTTQTRQITAETRIDHVPHTNESNNRSFVSDSLRGLNLLLVPYPYSIPANSFLVKPPTASEILHRRKRFEVDPNKWLEDISPTQDGQAHHIASGLKLLIDEAVREVGRIDGVVLPELALTHEIAERVSTSLFTKYALHEHGPGGMRFFVSGVLSGRKTEDGGYRPVNAVFTRVHLALDGLSPTQHDLPRRPYIDFRRLQIKHHRWNMDRRQIATYNLSSVLSINEDSNGKSVEWWEDTDITERECLFWAIGDKLVMSTIVCEDLARIDPVQQALRAVGPNLVIAILMDGAQRPYRWSSRYATSLCDDPGGSVLTLTSLGMIRRSAQYERPEDAVVALWKDCFGVTRELGLSAGAAAIVVSLAERNVTERTAAGREQDKREKSKKLVLSGVREVRVSSGASPKKMFLRL